jgi:hypothetical protein
MPTGCLHRDANGAYSQIFVAPILQGGASTIDAAKAQLQSVVTNQSVTTTQVGGVDAATRSGIENGPQGSNMFVISW